MRDMMVIARREFVERVRSKWFVVITLLWPLLMVGMIVVPALLGNQGTAGAKVAIVDRSDVQSGAAMQTKLAFWLKWNTTIVPPDTDEKDLKRQIKSGSLNGYVIIPKDVLEDGEIIYTGDNASNQTVTINFQRVVQSVVLKQRAHKLGVSDETFDKLDQKVNFSVRHSTGEETEATSGILTFFIGYFLAFGIYMMITLYGVGVMRSVVTEKSNRVVELLVAAVKPNAMMSGKILGIGLAGLAQIAIWVVVGGFAIHYRDNLLHMFGASSSSGMLLPTLTLSQILVVVSCFVLGYLFYSAMYAAVGAMVSSEQDTQQAQMPVTFLLVIAMVSIISIANDPRGHTAVLLTNVPFWSPMLMPMRYFLGGATTGQVVISLLILFVSTIVVARAAAKIYRVGILMYGKRPTVRELIRWLRY